jgi:hypothetical protein
MPLNHLVGERIDGLDPVFCVVPVSKYRDLPKLTVAVREEVGKKFKREVDVQRPIYEAALAFAQIALYKAGADPKYTSYDVLCQEHPRSGTVTFVFCANIGGKEHFVVAPFALAPQQIADLKARNLWQDLKVN